MTEQIPLVMETTKYNFDHILCPTDFSETAGIALEHAAYLSSKFGAKLTIINIRDSFSEYRILQEYGIPGREDKDYFNHVGQKLEEMAKDIRSLYNIKVETACKAGKIASEISKFVKEYGVSDLVIGMHGIKGRDPYFMGGNAYKIVNTTQVPVLQVDKHATTPNYKTIVLPIDSSFHTREKIPYAAALAKKYGAEIKIIVLQTSRDGEIRDHVQKVQYQVEKYIADHGVPFSTTVRSSDNLADDTLEFADEVNADLLIIMSEQEKTFKGLFLGPFAQQLVNISTRPVLTIPPKVHMVMKGVSI